MVATRLIIKSIITYVVNIASFNWMLITILFIFLCHNITIACG
jgi:hypothetical protein